MNIGKRSNNHQTRPFSAQNFARDPGKPVSRPGSAVPQQKLKRPYSAFVHRAGTQPPVDQELEVMIDEAKKVHYDFDPLNNYTKFSDISSLLTEFSIKNIAKLDSQNLHNTNYQEYFFLKPKVSKNTQVFVNFSGFWRSSIEGTILRAKSA